VKYVDDFVLLPKEETVLEGSIDNLIEIRKCCGIEMNVENGGNENHKATITSTDYNRSQTAREYGIFQLFGYHDNKYARYTREIKSRIGMAKPAFNKNKTLITRKLDLNLKKKLVNCYIWNIALYGAETWTLRKVDQKCLGSFDNVVLKKDAEDQSDRSCEK
jgi:hypothetical protein